MCKDRIIRHIARNHRRLRFRSEQRRRGLLTHVRYRIRRPSHEHITRLGTRCRFGWEWTYLAVILHRVHTQYLPEHFPRHAVIGLYIRSYLVARRSKRCQVHRLPFLIAPNVFHQIGIVDKRIAVMLDAVNSLIAVYLFEWHRVLTMPFKQKTQTIRREVRRIRHKHRRTIARIKYIVAIASHHIKERARKVAFVLVIRLKHSFITIRIITTRRIISYRTILACS